MIPASGPQAYAIRRVYKRDFPQLWSHFIRLDRDSRRARYGYAASDAFLCAYSESCLTRDVVLYGFFERGAIHGVGELHLSRDGTSRDKIEGELALSVERKWRRRGIGEALVDHLLLAARNRRVARLTVVSSFGNDAMLSLARKYAPNLLYAEFDVKIDLPVEGPSIHSRFREVVENALSLAVTAVEQHARNFCRIGLRIQRVS